MLANAVNTATRTSSLLTCHTNPQPRAARPHHGARTGSAVPRWRNPSTKHSSGSSLTNCKFGVKFYLPHALLCTTKHPNIRTSKLHKHTLMTKELLHGLRMLHFCSSGCVFFFFCPLPLSLFTKTLSKEGEGGAGAGNCSHLRTSSECAKFARAFPT